MILCLDTFDTFLELVAVRTRAGAAVLFFIAACCCEKVSNVSNSTIQQRFQHHSASLFVRSECPNRTLLASPLVSRTPTCRKLGEEAAMTHTTGQAMDHGVGLAQRGRWPTPTPGSPHTTDTDKNQSTHTTGQGVLRKQ